MDNNDLLPDAGYRVPAKRAQAELREKGSRFLALVAPVATPAAATVELEDVRRRFADATHHCWAWRLGEQLSERSSDDGEPGGTAGVPMLQVLRGAALSDVHATVVRWYGGTKLGKGGLARAYAGALGLAVRELSIDYRVPRVEVTVNVGYGMVGALKRLVQPPKVELREETYGEQASFRLQLNLTELDRLREAFAQLQAEWKVLPEPLHDARD